MINQVSGLSSSGLAYKTAGNNNTASKTEEKKAGMYDTAFTVDISVTGSTKSSSSSSKLSADEIQALKDQADTSAAALKDMVEKLITNQQKNTSLFSVSLAILGVTGETQTSQTDAAAAIGVNGEWSVDAVSDRIVSFAKAISGGDASKIEMLRDAIDKGFASAKKTLGGTLPDISSQTYDAVMSKLDDWAGTAEAGTAEAGTAETE